MNNFDVFIFAGEKSADRIGSNLIKELKNLSPNIKIIAVGGPLMKNEGINLLMNMEEFEVMGFSDVISFLPKIFKNFFFLKKNILKINPKVLIFIDYPDFNLRLEKQLRKSNFNNKIIHFISPTVWAWRKKRSNFLAKYVDLLLCVFPFEKKYYSHTNLDVRYIGHPLAFEIQNYLEEKNNFQHYSSKKLIGIFPGSRKKEITRNLPIQLEAVKKLINDDETLEFAISSANDCLIQDIFNKSGLDKKRFIFVKSDKNYELMTKLKMAIATSGTINLELALFKVPTIVNFKIKAIDEFIAKNILRINLQYYCIVNILLNEKIFTELYGSNLSIDNLYLKIKELFFDENAQFKIKDLCQKLIDLLKTKNPSNNAAEIILSFLK